MGARFRLSVCKGPNCRFNGADEVFRSARDAVKQQGFQEACLVGRGGCYGMCSFGPNLIIRAHDPAAPPDPLSRADYMLLGGPDEFLYSSMAKEQVERIIAEHIGRGAPVTEWLHENRPLEKIPA
jgi:(2Fe-2S) ferredoxin